MVYKEKEKKENIATAPIVTILKNNKLNFVLVATNLINQKQKNDSLTQINKTFFFQVGS
jgi:hypothetical protein